MKKLLLWQQRAVIGLNKLIEDRDLENIFWDFIDPDDYDGEFSGRGWWRRELAINKLEELLGWPDKEG